MSWMSLMHWTSKIILSKDCIILKHIVPIQTMNMHVNNTTDSVSNTHWETTGACNAEDVLVGVMVRLQARLMRDITDTHLDCQEFTFRLRGSAGARRGIRSERFDSWETARAQILATKSLLSAFNAVQSHIVACAQRGVQSSRQGGRACQHAWICKGVGDTAVIVSWQTVWKKSTLLWNPFVTVPNRCQNGIAPYFPLRGNGWYYHSLVQYCLDNNIITKYQIKYVIHSSSTVIKHDYYNGFINYCNEICLSYEEIQEYYNKIDEISTLKEHHKKMKHVLIIMMENINKFM